MGFIILHFGFEHAHHEFDYLHNDFHNLHCKYIILLYDFCCQQLRYYHLHTGFSFKTGTLASKPAI